MKTIHHQARQWAAYHRQHIERRARLSAGRYSINLAAEWCAFLVRETLS